ncbi:MAG: DUF3276 family protein [Chitinophagia bacterium]|nr:DUF3276 family protein [Chitinophagia bacterium]
MEQENYENNNDRKIESVYSTRVRAGKRRTYFFDVRATRSNDYFLTITESRKRFDNNGYDRHKVFIYKEDFNKFIKAVSEAIDFVKTELMPDFDFDAFNHDEDEGAYAPDARVTPSAPDSSVTPPSNETQDDKDPLEITEKKPLEARDTKASEGDNLSGEEVEKW